MESVFTEHNVCVNEVLEAMPLRSIHVPLTKRKKKNRMMNKVTVGDHLVFCDHKLIRDGNVTNFNIL